MYVCVVTILIAINGNAGENDFNGKGDQRAERREGRHVNRRKYQGRDIDRTESKDFNFDCRYSEDCEISDW